MLVTFFCCWIIYFIKYREWKLFLDEKKAFNFWPSEGNVKVSRINHRVPLDEEIVQRHCQPLVISTMLVIKAWRVMAPHAMPDEPTYLLILLNNGAWVAADPDFSLILHQSLLCWISNVVQNKFHWWLKHAVRFLLIPKWLILL